ncbi:right-handed parallel beta-helix repeat-containing protein [Gimesia fumaroli]|uniref:right-handed parallel beta-helix repeat-containing protein n=1 Tax=Gimesia fumaroli TaxID=2527976 RepID=UPI0011AB295E|nr:right-handed parallel beta-helix repeat-containing protein [Gimesia fumaroli]
MSESKGETYYVNNQTGNDTNDGLSPDSAVATIAMAIQLSKTSDRLELKNTGIAYREPMLFRRLGGLPNRPFEVEGNGAVLSGLKEIDASRWQTMKDNLYVLTLKSTPYGNPYLVAQGKRLDAAKNLESIEPEQHFWDRKTNKVYLLCAAQKRPADYQLEATLTTSGFTLGSASYITCRNLICEHFSNDGFNIHGDCRGIRLENVIARHNGDDGISIHETGGLMVQNAYVHNNFYGIQDVNASRSVYNGVLAEQNQVGVSLVGGYHSLVDCQIRNSVQKEIDIAGSNPRHLIGAEQNLLCKTILFAQNVSLFGDGNRVALSVRNGASLIMEQSVINGSDLGLFVDQNSHCHLSLTTITDCHEILKSESKDSFFDFNIYGTGQISWLGTVFQPAQWTEYLQISKRDQNSKMGMVMVAEDGIVSIPANSTASGMMKKVGPSAPFTFSLPQN